MKNTRYFWQDERVMKPLLQVHITTPFDYFPRIPWSESHQLPPNPAPASARETPVPEQNPPAFEIRRQPITGGALGL